MTATDDVRAEREGLCGWLRRFGGGLKPAIEAAALIETQDAEIKRLTRAFAELHRQSEMNADLYRRTKMALEACQGRAERAEAEVARLREALQPFGQRAARYDDRDSISTGDSCELWQLEGNRSLRVDITVGDLRPARAALQPRTPSHG